MGLSGSRRRLRRHVPDAVCALELDERRLAWGVTDDGRPLVATESTLHIGDRVIAWAEVETAMWKPPVLTVVEVSDTEGAGSRHALTVADDDRLAEVVRARVTSSVGWTDVRRLEPSGKVRVVARRVPGQDALLWQVVHLDGTDPHDPRVRAQVAELVASLRASLG